MAEMLKSSTKPRNKEEYDLIFKRLNKERKERNQALSKGDQYGPITKKWLFGLLELRYPQSKGDILANVIWKIRDLDKIAPEVMGKGVRNPEGLRE